MSLLYFITCFSFGWTIDSYVFYGTPLLLGA
jgi:hypothetical protein